MLLCSKILLRVPQYEYTSFATMATYWDPDLPDIKTVFIKKNIAVKKLNCASLQVRNIRNDL